uniref:Uncharacterized protein n=1 Tax=Knipowitschia caucasica TaxID=637954 RepID=A0AAV2LSD7_KNICA
MVKASPTLKLSSSVSQDPPQTSVWTWSQMILHKLQSGPGPRCESLRSDWSKELPRNFRSDQSMGEPWDLKTE